jgi:hypothetical protein
LEALSQAAIAAGIKQASVYFVCDALFGLWGGLGAPWAFVRLRLADARRVAT